MQQIHHLVYKKRLALVTTPFIGHINGLLNWAKKHKQANADASLTFIITGWNNIRLAAEIRHDIESSGMKLVEIYDENMIVPAPFDFTFPRVTHLVDKVIDACRDHEVILYDYFSLEGHIAGHHLSIPAICCTAATLGPFNPKNDAFLHALEENKASIQALEIKFSLSLFNRLEMLADGFFLPSQPENLLWSWQKLIEAGDFAHNRKLNKTTFLRPVIQQPVADDYANLIVHLRCIKSHKKIIYLSLGTIVMRYLWEGIPALREFVSGIFSCLIENFGHHTDYEVIVATGRKVGDVFQSLPANFHVYESVPQQAILQYADVFITHGGGNSVNEAIDAEVPMVVIPFFGDQHQCAANVQKLQIGRAFLHEEKDRESVINPSSGLYARKSLTNKQDLITAIDKIVKDKFVLEKIKALKD